jgi:hypothetical protein
MRNLYDQTATSRLLSDRSRTLLEGTMLPDAPERLLMVRLHQAELRTQAAEHRRSHEGVDPVDGCTFSGLHLKMGRLLIIVGRTITRPDPDCPDVVGADPAFS